MHSSPMVSHLGTTFFDLKRYDSNISREDLLPSRHKDIYEYTIWNASTTWIYDIDTDTFRICKPQDGFCAVVTKGTVETRGPFAYPDLYLVDIREQLFFLVPDDHVWKSPTRAEMPHLQLDMDVPMHTMGPDDIVAHRIQNSTHVVADHNNPHTMSCFTPEDMASFRPISRDVLFSCSEEEKVVS